VSVLFDVDGMALRNAALGHGREDAKVPEDFAALAEAMLKLTDEYVMADQYDAAEKASALAAQHARKANDVTLALRTTSRNRDVTEAKALYKAMKNISRRWPGPRTIPPATRKWASTCASSKGPGIWECGF